MSGAPAPRVSVMEVLVECGWMVAPDVQITESPARRYDFGNFELIATTLTNFHLQSIVNFEGLYNDGRTLEQVQFEVPERVESRAQLLAWIAHGMGDGIPLAITPGWLEEGRRSRGLLPWERKRAAYNARPQASVDRDWMRILGKQLVQEALQTVDTDTCRVHFDGSALRFHLPHKTLLVQARGPAAWSVDVIISLTALRDLPKRWMRDPVDASYWDGRFVVASHGFAATTESTTAAPNSP